MKNGFFVINHRILGAQHRRPKFDQKTAHSVVLIAILKSAGNSRMCSLCGTLHCATVKPHTATDYIVGPSSHTRDCTRTLCHVFAKHVTEQSSLSFFDVRLLAINFPLLGALLATSLRVYRIPSHTLLHPLFANPFFPHPRLLLNITPSYISPPITFWYFTTLTSSPFSKNTAPFF